MDAKELIWVIAGVGIGLTLSMVVFWLAVMLAGRRLRRRLARRQSLRAVTSVQRDAPLSTPLPSPRPAVSLVEPPPPADDDAEDLLELSEPAVSNVAEADPVAPGTSDRIPDEAPLPPESPRSTSAAPVTVEGLFSEAFRVEAQPPAEPTPPAPPVAPPEPAGEWRPAKPRSQQTGQQPKG